MGVRQRRGLPRRHQEYLNALQANLRLAGFKVSGLMKGLNLLSTASVAMLVTVDSDGGGRMGWRNYIASSIPIRKGRFLNRTILCRRARYTTGLKWTLLVGLRNCLVQGCFLPL